MKIILSITCTALILAAGSASAGSVVLDGLGGDVTLKSKDVSNLFDAAAPDFTNTALRAMHSDIKASGIDTDGLVTFVLAETTDGLTFLSLVDDERRPEGQHLDSEIGMSTTGPDSLAHWINDSSQDIALIFDPPTQTQTAAGHFNWNAASRGDAFGWSRLAAGDFVSFNFTRGGPGHDSYPGLNEEDTFQFLSWDGQQWNVAATGEFSQADDFAFSFTVIPLPAPVLLGAAGLAAVGVIRRRTVARKH